MRSYVNRKYLLLTCLMFFLTLQAHALDLDETVDDELRKNYDYSKLQKDMDIEESLPSLPEISKYNKPEAATPKKDVNPPQYSLTAGTVKISAGTSFDVVNSSKVSDWLRKGSTVKFYNRVPIIKKKYTIPANTVFYGEVIESHQPQISCNGGLVVIRLKSMTYKGQTIPINAYVTRADDKMIFLNNIKGERTYLKTMWKKGNWGRTLFNRMLTMTVNLGGDGATLLFSPFPFAYGTICLGLNTLTSPITAFFSKGGHVSIASGSRFRVKFMDDTFIE